jgi:tricarballylate dehydrogenase
MSSAKYDVLVIGGGNAALCAALMARRAGRKVLVIEHAPREWRGGNSIHTRNFRCMHDAPTETLTDAYPEDEYWRDLLDCTGGATTESLARMVIRGSNDARPWMHQQGARYQPAMTGTLHVSRTNCFFMGGGKALMNAYYRTAESLGIEVWYNSEAVDLNIRDGHFESVTLERAGEGIEVSAKACVVASGGFESNREWLAEAWGEPAKNFLIRGTRFNRGRLLRLLIDEKGAERIGDPTQGHCVAIDARAPLYDGGIATRVDCVPFGIVVNRHAQRFYDEGEKFWPHRYAIWGRLVAQQPDQIAYSIIDAKSPGKFMPPVFPPSRADSIHGLAAELGLDPDALEATVTQFNDAVRPGTFDHNALDDCRTEGLAIPKTHWARRLDTPPYYAYPLRPGITFTYLGVKVNEKAQIVMRGGESDNLFAAGEIMAGNILGKGYIAGIGMAIGSVFGRIAGEEAARFAR